MTTQSYKRDIIELIKRMGREIGAGKLGKLFNSSDAADGKKAVGCNQFREIAADCRVAECYEEIELLIQYTQSKAEDKNDKKNEPAKSWKMICENGKPFGETVTDYMQEVRRLCGENAEWDTVREPMQLFFGYLYWQSRIWADSNQTQNGTRR